jgi:hypothetical protein
MDGSNFDRTFSKASSKYFIGEGPLAAGVTALLSTIPP